MRASDQTHDGCHGLIFLIRESFVAGPLLEARGTCEVLSFRIGMAAANSGLCLVVRYKNC